MTFALNLHSDIIILSFVIHSDIYQHIYSDINWAAYIFGSANSSNYESTFTNNAYIYTDNLIPWYYGKGADNDYQISFFWDSNINLYSAQVI